MSDRQFTFEELSSLVNVVNEAGKYQAMMIAGGIQFSVGVKLEFLKIAKRVGEEHDAALKLEKKTEEAKKE